GDARRIDRMRGWGWRIAFNAASFSAREKGVFEGVHYQVQAQRDWAVRQAHRPNEGRFSFGAPRLEIVTTLAGLERQDADARKGALWICLNESEQDRRAADGVAPRLGEEQVDCVIDSGASEVRDGI